MASYFEILSKAIVGTTGLISFYFVSKDHFYPNKALESLDLVDKKLPPDFFKVIRKIYEKSELYRPDKIKYYITNRPNNYTLGSTYLPNGAVICLSSSLFLNSHKDLLDYYFSEKHVDPVFTRLVYPVNEAFFHENVKNKNEMIHELKSTLIEQYPEDIIISICNSIGHLDGQHFLFMVSCPILYTIMYYFLLNSICKLSTIKLSTKIWIVVGLLPISTYYLIDMFRSYNYNICTYLSDRFTVQLDEPFKSFILKYLHRKQLIDKTIHNYFTELEKPLLHDSRRNYFKNSIDGVRLKNIEKEIKFHDNSKGLEF